MKIRIEYSSIEKSAIINAVDCNFTKDESVISKGSFGEAEYNSKENYIELNLKETFTVGVAALMGSWVNMIKGFINTCNIFKTSWLDDIKTEFPDRDTEENNDQKE